MLLEETLLHRPSDANNVVADGPFPKGNFADAPGVKPLEHNTSLAVMLVAAARKEMGGAPIELRFEYPAIPEAQAVVPLIAEAFRFAGVRIETIERAESELETALARAAGSTWRIGHCGAMSPFWTPEFFSVPVTTLHPMLTLLARRQAPHSPALAPARTRADVPTARGLIIQIDRESRDELPVLPLWQVVDHYAWRTRLRAPEMLPISFIRASKRGKSNRGSPRTPGQPGERARQTPGAGWSLRRRTCAPLPLPGNSPGLADAACRFGEEPPASTQSKANPATASTQPPAQAARRSTPLPTYPRWKRPARPRQSIANLTGSSFIFIRSLGPD